MASRKKRARRTRTRPFASSPTGSIPGRTANLHPPILSTSSLAPAQSLATLYQSVSHSLGLAAQNAVFAQQQANILHQSVTTTGVNLLYTLSQAKKAKRARKRKN